MLEAKDYQGQICKWCRTPYLTRGLHHCPNCGRSQSAVFSGRDFSATAGGDDPGAGKGDLRSLLRHIDKLHKALCVPCMEGASRREILERANDIIQGDSDLESILQEADALVSGDRREDYGHPADDFKRTAQMWSAILGVDVSPEQVPLCMIALKISRECHKPKRDNRVDIAGYAKTLDMVAS